MQNDIAVHGIYELLEGKGKEAERNLKEILASFSCSKNPDVERFLKEQSIEFTKKNQSITYIAVSKSTRKIAGYFTLTVKPLALQESNMPSKTFMRRIARISEIDNVKNTYYLWGYLIAQLGKNDGSDISGVDLMDAALETLRDIQKKIGGIVTYVEVEPNEKLLEYYKRLGFKEFDTKISKKEEPLVQLLRTL